MKASEFKSFLSIVETAGSDNPIWCYGFAFMNLTPAQHAKIWDTLNAKGLPHQLVTNQMGTFDGIELPNGLVLLK